MASTNPPSQEIPDNIVVSSRVRLARNLLGHPFPGWAKKADRLRVVEVIRPVVQSIEEMEGGFSETMDSLSAIEKQVLVERHLISREHAAKNVGSAIVINRAGTLAVMINEEDHMRMQAITTGFKLKDVYQMIDRIDSKLAVKLPFAFHPRLGFLTACPTNVGTGMRASAMLHLPALVLLDHINKIVQAVNKLGLAVRGLYGEGTEALGNLFQISNQTTLGEKEAAILDRIEKVIAEIVKHEQNARLTLLEKNPRMVYDHIGRAYGVLANAQTITSKETMNLLSMLSLGIDLKLFDDMTHGIVDRLFMDTQPAHLQRNHNNQKLAPEDRDGFRADYIRARLAEIRRPKFALPPKSDGG
ncbi:MAG: protein arginine kinase [Verrucomicrobia bacterium]|nr:protein arginine kinase [Verrucomicrobiota bacterium]